MEMPLDKPYDEPGRPELADLYRKADRVYISHGHFDHIYHFKNLYKETEYPEGADLLIMALQGRADQDDYAMQFVKKLKPKEIMLYHIDDSFPPMSSEVDTLGFEINAKKAGYTCFKPEKNREYEI